MKVLRWLNIIFLLIFLSACGANGIVGSFSPTDTALPPPGVTIVPAPDAGASLTAYLNAFKIEDYDSMYGMLSKVTQDGITLEDFAKRNRDALNEMSAGSFDYEVLSTLMSAYSSQVAYRVTYHTALVGEIQRDMIARFALENNQWKLQWDDSLILPELAGGNVLHMDYSIPSRGNIYDRNGDGLAAQSDAYAFKIIPGNVTEDSLNVLVSEAGRLCGLDPNALAEQIANTPAQFPIPLCEASAQEAERILSIAPSGLYWDAYNSRYYFEQGAASNVVGYTQFVPKEELDAYRRKGYQSDERVGAIGIEKWGEENADLAGKRGGTLYVTNPTTGAIVTRIAESAPKPADSIYLTIDRNMQFYAQEALRGFKGAVVVMELNTGRVLAMASAPTFDSNAFEPNNPNGSNQLSEYQNEDQPYVNRAAQGQYPLGSVFKIITMSAGMESGLFTPETTLDCQYDWTLLPDQIRHDWTWDHCQVRLRAGKECNTADSQPSGVLTLPEGLMRSCNPFFWQIGYTLNQNNRSDDIAKMARAFGLGSPTGIQQIEELPGQIKDPPTVIDVVNQAIGQGDVQVTPLQVARFVAAVGNGGTLYRPQLVEKTQPVDGAPTIIFKPEATGTLPVTPDRLKVIQDAMWEVTHNPRGTAYFRMRGLQIPVAGKTGTAESGSGLPHGWFAGYTLANESTGLPDIAIAVVVENQGEGSDYGAPIFRAMVETYYLGSPQSRPWFGPIGGPLYTPTPFGGIPTKTPKP